MTRAVPEGKVAILFGSLKTIYPICAKFTPGHMPVSAMVGLAELTLYGRSVSADHLYLYPNGSWLGDAIEAADNIGIRFVPTRGAMSISESDGWLPLDNLVEAEVHILEDCIRVVGV